MTGLSPNPLQQEILAISDESSSFALTQPELEKLNRDIETNKLRIQLSAFLQLLSRVNEKLESDEPTIAAATSTGHEIANPDLLHLSDGYIPANSMGVVGFRFIRAVGEIFEDGGIRMWIGELPADVDEEDELVPSELLEAFMAIMRGVDSDWHQIDPDGHETGGMISRSMSSLGRK